MQIPTFDEWQRTQNGSKCCDLSPYTSTPKKQHPSIIARIHQAYNDGVKAARPVEQELELMPPAAKEPTE